LFKDGTGGQKKKPGYQGTHGSSALSEVTKKDDVLVLTTRWTMVL
jgi:hypothetical protein